MGMTFEGLGGQILEKKRREFFCLSKLSSQVKNLSSIKGNLRNISKNDL